MKKIILFFLVFFSISSYSQIKKSVLPKFDYSKPEQVLESLFYSAKTKKYFLLNNLCDPEQKGDIQSLCVCKLSGKYNYSNVDDCKEMTKDYFNVLFSKAKNPVVLSNNGMYATVSYDVENVSPSMELVKRGNRWYIFSLSSNEN